MQKSIRNIDDAVFEEAKKLAADKDIAVGEAVNEALLKWINENRRPEKDINDFEPVSLGEEDLSESYEEEIYG